VGIFNLTEGNKEMNQENLLLLKELLPTLSLDDILHAYSAYTAASCIGWVLVVVSTVWVSLVTYKAIDTEGDGDGRLIASLCVGLVGFIVSLVLLDLIIKAMLPLGALISCLVN
jgi:hypothetical protein